MTEIARGPGPRWLRLALAGLASLYFVALVRHPPQVGPLHALGFFTESTCLFPGASRFALEFRLEAWSCPRKRWEPLDPRAYFPIEADDKESRFQRLGHFYQQSRPAMTALDEWIAARHDRTDDGVAGPIGGIRLVKQSRSLPAPGEPVARYAYDPLAPIPKDERKDLYATRPSERKARCGL